jgi:BirA family biotin operon repressor/biotin-[acetyl-CoA-carboxylase] ligase
MAFQESDIARLRSHPAIDRLDFHEKTASTNDVALKTALGDETLRLILAERQTAGRGRRANTWWAGEGALAFSLLIDCRRLGVTQDLWPMLPLAAGLASTQAIRSFVCDVDATVKWPNDVYLGDRKVAGILAETRGDAPGCVIVGIGINVNTCVADAPDGVDQIAVSMADFGGPFDRVDVLCAVIENISAAIDLLLEGSELFVRRLNGMSYLTGKQVTVRTETEAITGLCRGVAVNGALLLDTPRGSRNVIAGTVTVV